MKLLPEKFLFFLPLRTGGLALGVFGAIAGIVGICGGLEGLEDIVEIFTLGLFTIRSLSSMYAKQFCNVLFQRKNVCVWVSSN